MINKTVFPGSSTRLKQWGIFFLYLVVAGYAMAHHELWGDEIHSWNIAKASDSFSDLLKNSRYEGHPPVWYMILWGISKFTHNLLYLQIVQWIIASSVVFVLVFYSPFSLITKLLIPFGYYFLFEYGVLSRNYAIGILPAFCLCHVMQKEFRHKLIVYYALLFFMSNTHLLALILAGSVHLYFLLLKFGQTKRFSQVLIHALLGALLFLPALYFIFPPSDSGLSISKLTNEMNMEDLRLISKTPLRAFIPVPAWWEYNFWNTQFLLTLQGKNTFLRLVTLLLSLGVLSLVWFVLRNDKKGLVLFFSNLVLTFLTGFLFPLTTQRYIGFIYIGFIVACWLGYGKTLNDRRNKQLMNIIIAIQLIAGIFLSFKDARLPFSNSYRVNELISEVPAHEKIVTDYWCVNTTLAFTDSLFYTIGLDTTVRFLQWKGAIDKRSPGVYRNGLQKLFAKEKMEKIYMISTYSLQHIYRLDPLVKNSFQLILVDKREDAIEKWSNLYLYEIRPVQ